MTAKPVEAQVIVWSIGWWWLVRLEEWLISSDHVSRPQYFIGGTFFGIRLLIGAGR